MERWLSWWMSDGWTDGWVDGCSLGWTVCQRVRVRGVGVRPKGHYRLPDATRQSCSLTRTVDVLVPQPPSSRALCRLLTGSLLLISYVAADRCSLDAAQCRQKQSGSFFLCLHKQKSFVCDVLFSHKCGAVGVSQNWLCLITDTKRKKKSLWSFFKTFKRSFHPLHIFAEDVVLEETTWKSLQMKPEIFFLTTTIRHLAVLNSPWDSYFWREFHSAGQTKASQLSLEIEIQCRIDFDCLLFFSPLQFSDILCTQLKTVCALISPCNYT